MRRRVPVTFMAQKKNDDEEVEWKAPGVFSPENAGPWLILLVTGVFQGLATLPREQVPEPLASLIPVVLGQQYGGP